MDYYPSNIRYICIILYLGIQIKRFPNELVPKIKARFYGRGDLQIEGVDFFETYAPIFTSNFIYSPQPLFYASVLHF